MSRWLLEHPGLIAFWDFQEEPGRPRLSQGAAEYGLLEGAGPVARVEGGLFGPYAARIDEGQWFYIPRADCPLLDIHGPDAEVTVAAWVKRGKATADNCEAVAGMWNETRRKRQYCLFLNLRIWESHHQVCGHVSAIGGPTPGYRWCMDASIGSSPVPFDQWQFVAFTYDGEYARSYLNGRLDVRPERNPYRYEGGLYDGGEDGADFTVGGVHRLGEMGNWFTGVIGGLAVFGKALSSEQIAQLHREVPLPTEG